MDSKMDVDIGKLPEPHRLSPATEPQSIPTLDGWIENLMNCKQLAENDVQRLCDRVRLGNLALFRGSYGAFDEADIVVQQAREVLTDESNVQPVVCNYPYPQSKQWLSTSQYRNAQLQSAATYTANSMI